MLWGLDRIEFIRNWVRVHVTNHLLDNAHIEPESVFRVDFISEHYEYVHIIAFIYLRNSVFETLCNFEFARSFEGLRDVVRQTGFSGQCMQLYKVHAIQPDGTNSTSWSEPGPGQCAKYIYTQHCIQKLPVSQAGPGFCQCLFIQNSLKRMRDCTYTYSTNFTYTG